MWLRALLCSWREGRRSCALFDIYRIEYHAIVFVKTTEKPLYNTTRNGKAFVERTISAEVSSRIGF